MWKITGARKDFLVETSKRHVLLGGIKQNKADDGREKEVAVANRVAIKMRKGAGHQWTRFSEDCVLVVEGTVLLVAVFDGVSGAMDGSGGIAARKAAELLREKAEKINRANYGKLLREWNDECRFAGSTTALVFLEVGKKRIVLNKGDSVCFVNGEQLNERHGLDSVVTRVLGDGKPFDEYDVPEGEVELCSDGIYDEGDDVTTVVVK